MAPFKTGLWTTVFHEDSDRPEDKDRMRKYIDQKMHRDMMDAVQGLLGLETRDNNVMYRSYSYQYLGTGVRVIPGWNKPDVSYGNIYEAYPGLSYLVPGYIREIRMQWAMALVDPLEAFVGDFVHAKAFSTSSDMWALPIAPKVDTYSSFPQSVPIRHYNRRRYWVDMGCAVNGMKIEELTLWERVS